MFLGDAAASMYTTQDTTGRMAVSSDEDVDIGERFVSSRHNVQFYESDEFLIDSVSAFISAGLKAGDNCIVIATKPHREQIKRRLAAEGAQLSAARLAGQYAALDADKTLAHIMVDGSPDPERFAKVIGGIIRRISHRQPGRRVRVFGEMASLLWQEGRGDATIRMEELWNNLRDTLAPFSLFCSYPLRSFAGEQQRGSFIAICERHTNVMPAESYTALATAAERDREIALLQQRATSLEAETVGRKLVEEQLRQMEARKDAFLNMVSHELKTPVTSIKAFAQLLQRRMSMKGDADPRMLAMLDRMEAQIEKLIGIISDLLDFSQIQSGTTTYHDTCFDFDAMVHEAVSDTQAIAPTHTIHLEGETNAQVYGDRDRLAQALSHLLTNAIKFSPDAENIFVRLSADPEPGSGLIKASVQDYGVGIAEHHQAYIFERFYRISDERGNSYTGLGIGLYIARQIVERHGGRLWVESREDEGSIFHVVLPHARSDTVPSHVNVGEESISSTTPG